MTKKASKSKSSRSSSPTSANSANRASSRKLVLRIKSNETTGMSTRQNKRSKTKLKTKQKAKKKADAKMPKKPPTAFFYFLEDFRKEFQEQNPDVKSMRDVGKACGDKWRTMTYEEKVKYYDIATEKRAEFDSAMAEYIKRKESGEDEETDDDDSEFE